MPRSAEDAFSTGGASRKVRADAPLVELTKRPKETVVTTTAPKPPTDVAAPGATPADPTQTQLPVQTGPSQPIQEHPTESMSAVTAAGDIAAQPPVEAPVPGGSAAATATTATSQPSNGNSAEEPMEAEATADTAPPPAHPSQPPPGYPYPPHHPHAGYPYPPYHMMGHPPPPPHWGQYPPPYPYMHHPYGPPAHPHHQPPQPTNGAAAQGNNTSQAAATAAPASSESTNTSATTASSPTKTSVTFAASTVDNTPKNRGDAAVPEKKQGTNKSVVWMDPANKSPRMKTKLPSNDTKPSAEKKLPPSKVSAAVKRPPNSLGDRQGTKTTPPAKKPHTGAASEKKAKRKSNRPLSEQEILRAFPTADASSVLMLHGRKIDMDATPGLDTAATSPFLPLYPILRAWMQDDPFRTIPRAEASIDIWSTTMTSTTPSPASVGEGILPGTAPAGDAGTAKPPLSPVATAETKTLPLTVNQSEKTVDDLRQEMVQRGKALRRLHSKNVQQHHKLGLERLRQRGIHL